MGAAMTGATETVELLLSHGADVHARDKDGDTALKWASRGGFNNVVRLLKAHGAKE
jgi:ankyrin repeat protein